MKRTRTNSRNKNGRNSLPLFAMCCCFGLTSTSFVAGVMPPHPDSGLLSSAAAAAVASQRRNDHSNTTNSSSTSSTNTNINTTTTTTAWMPVHQYRRSLGLEYGYQPQLLHPELCKFATEEVCEDMDHGLMEHSRKLLDSRNSVNNFNDNNNDDKKKKPLQVLVVLMQFANHDDNGRDLIDYPDVDLLFNSQGKGGDVVPTGSIQSYLRINSDRSMNIEATIIPWYVVSKTEQDCTFGNSGMDTQFQKCFWPVLDALDELHTMESHSFRWENYDQDFDGIIDSLVVMHSGYGAEWGNTDPNGKTATDRIWTHSAGPTSDRWKSKSFLMDLGAYTVTSVFSGHEGSTIAPIGVVLHEMLHTFGLPALFDMSITDNDSETNQFLEDLPVGGLGSYSIMSNPWGQGKDARYPGHMDPWSKLKLGWIKPTPITKSGSYTMMPSEMKPDIFIVGEPYYPKGEYLLIENRQSLHYDAKMWGNGVLIYHVDDNVVWNTKAGGPYQEGWPENGNHYQVALMQKDGRYELEQAVNNGHEDDFFRIGIDSLGPGNARSVYPNTDSYQGGNIVSTGITFSNFQKTGLRMSFEVSGIEDTTDLVTDDGSNSSDSSPYTTVTPPQNQIMPLPVPATASECVVNVNVQLCSEHVSRAVPQEGCDCYNFCGNGQGQECCAFGEACHIKCNSGGLIAGCTLDGSSGTTTNGSTTNNIGPNSATDGENSNTEDDADSPKLPGNKETNVKSGKNEDAYPILRAITPGAENDLIETTDTIKVQGDSTIFTLQELEKTSGATSLSGSKWWSRYLAAPLVGLVASTACLLNYY